MSTSTKIPASIRHGGPGASRENAKAGLKISKPAVKGRRRRSQRSGGGGERDSHHAHSPKRKAGG